ncbi:MAG: phosphotransferase [Candidatus Obscuribacterales bacterium]
MTEVDDAARLRLIDIQKLQFADRGAAELALLALLQKSEDAAITRVELRPKPESLNSINGFVTFGESERYFFKMHVEENERLDEYYNAKALADAGYPVVTAKQITHRPGKQLVLYEIIEFATLFDVAKATEDELLQLRGAHEASNFDAMVAAQNQLDEITSSIYARTLKQTPETDDRRAPIHQLFSHRLAEDGRLRLFYRGKTMKTEAGTQVDFDELANMHWVINGVRYGETLNEIIERAQIQLAPAAGPSVVGHGDAHNGNVFFDAADNRLLLFDPAFAGRHHPLLDLTKPLFHNVFARWMYYPDEVDKEFTLGMVMDKDIIEITHNFEISSLREAFLESKLKHVLRPTLELLQAQGMLRGDWQTYLRSSLFCCPFLTVNHFAPYKADGTLSERYSFGVRMLGLSMAVELGSGSCEGSNSMTSRLDRILESPFAG